MKVMNFDNFEDGRRKPKEAPQIKYHCHYCGNIFLQKDVKFTYKRSDVQTSLGGFDEAGKITKGKKREAPTLVRCTKCGRACRKVNSVKK